MEKYYLIVAYVMMGLVGLCIGSFLNVVIYRVPNKMSLATPPSHCPTCKYQLRWYDNIPVLSYLMLGGKCRSCKNHISFRYTAVELINCLLWICCVERFWQASVPMAIIYALALSTLICVYCIDLEHKIIPDRFHVIILCLAFASLFFDKDYDLVSHLLGGIIFFFAFYLIGLGFEKAMGREALGGGDIKLVGAVGFLIGWERMLLSILVATIPAAIIMVVAERISNKTGKSREFPFAPFLVIGFAFSIFFGKGLIDWYLSLLGL